MEPIAGTTESRKSQNATAEKKPARGQLRLVAKIEPDGGTVKVVGRDAWMLERLIAAGQRGVRPVDHPAPRHSHYVFKLRGLGFLIETVHEAHGGAFPGHHARYVLHSQVTILENRGMAA
ncbi:winged helix domain-containing protein [Oryzicola mucosus]|uniref:winged helix domain-containing protein n=1 Tax=Oryzicola mucosus TaxID=2767425 RepID=UPI001E5A4DAA|nr:hypothetical protein [Oryzicola mucosus]